MLTFIRDYNTARSVTEIFNRLYELLGHEVFTSLFPVILTDSGCHYRWPEWIEIIESAGLTRSMSKKGCSPDNSACEGFLARINGEI